jgi:NitT/TauT family transport system permease protein
MTYVLGRNAAPSRSPRAVTAQVLRRVGGAATSLAGLPLLLLLVALWEVAPRLGWMSPIFFPPFSRVMAALGDMIASGEMGRHVGISFQRAGLGFVLATIVAVPLGLLMGRYAAFERATDLLVQTLRNTSQFALLPVFVLLLGIGEASKVAITFYAAVFFILVNTIVGVRSVDPLLLKAARSMGTSDWDLFRKVILPSSVPSIVAGMRLGVKASLFSVIAAEMLAARSGIGFLIQNSQLMLNAADMYAGILMLTAVGLLLNYLLVWIERRATHWRASDGDQPH